MGPRGHIAVLFVFLAACFGLCAQSAPGPQKYALLIGIDTYQPAGTKIRRPTGADAKGRFAIGMVFDNLKGPANDVAHMRALLTSAKFGFPDDEQHIHTLMDDKATRQAILDAMNTYIGGAKPGDTVVLYISSHGSLRVNDAGNGQLYQLEDEQHKLDSTIVPADAYLGAEDISSRELRDVLMKAATRGVHVTVIIDACHSGGQARGALDGMVKRSLSWDPRDLSQPALIDADGSPSQGPEDLGDNPVLVLSASQKDQSALDVQSSNPPHGLFTNALVHALEALPAGAKASDVFRRIIVDMEVDGGGNQQPALDSTAKRKAQPLFGGEAENGPVRATVIGVDDQGVVLDIGKVADIGVGSEFVETVDGKETLLRVKDYLGVDRSLAQQVSGPAVKAKDIVTRKIWVPAPQPEFYLYAGPANLTLAQVRAALAEVRTAKLALVMDPSTDPWTHIVFWDGTNWALQAHGSETAAAPVSRPAVVLLGTVLAASALTSKLPSAAVVWFDPPLPSELAAMPVLNEEHSAARLTNDRGKAAYVVAGAASSDGLRYAWYDRGAFDSDVQTPKGFGAGCSPTSAFPLRTNWVPLADDQKTALTPDDDPVTQLTVAAQRLAKLNGWLTLQTTATDADPFGYSLGLQRVSDKKLVADNGPLYKGERYSLVLNGSKDYAGHPRWVYVLGLDCQGSGKLLWPQDGPGGKFPTDSGRMDQIPLPGITVSITPPFGTDTYILLTTSSQLPEPNVLTFEGVVRSGSRGVSNPLEDLLKSTSGAARGFEVATPTDWGIQLLQTHSLPGRPVVTP
jgi:hypothetical protein